MLKRLVFVIFVIGSFWASGQDEYGIAHSNYAPTKTFLQNPTNTLDNKVWLDIHIVGSGINIYNNFMYMKGTQFAFGPNILGGKEWPEYHFNTNDSKKSGFQDSDLQLISASLQYKKHGLAFSTRLKTYFDFRRITPEIAQLIANGTDGFVDNFDQVLEGKRMFMNQMAYAEYAFSYSNTFYHFAHETMGAGITVKYLRGLTGAAVKIDEVEYNIQDPQNVDIFTYNGAVAYGTPPNEEGGGNTAGSGFAVDLGYVYKKTLHNVTHYEPYSEASACEPYDYKYKLSAAIIDLGYINYNKNATRYDIESSLTTSQLNGGEFTFDGFNDFADNNFTDVEVSDKFRMLTPAALNLLADYNFENYYYLSGQITHGFFRRNSFGVKRPNVWAISGRYQRKWFEGSINTSVYNFENLRLGTALRFGYLTLGTDKLLSMFGVWDFYGTDFYFNLRYFLGRRPGCARKEKRDGKLNATDCVKN